jgi:hypothetical protein
MLRVTVNNDSGAPTIRLEGRLAGPWVQEAQYCWQRLRANDCQGIIRLDLTGVTMIDNAGKEFLAAAHESGAKLVASGCMMRAIVAQIENTRAK